MPEFTVSKRKVLNENLYCNYCGSWVYCPEMNSRVQNGCGELVEQIGEGCLYQDAKGDYLICPDCQSRFYLEL